MTDKNINFKEKAETYLRLNGLDNVEEKFKAQFVEMCEVFKLNPLNREIYGVAYKDKKGKDNLNMIVNFNVYLCRASETGQLDGWRVWTEGNMKERTLKACIEIHRKDFSHPFYHEVLFTEYCQSSGLWGSKPITMIKKVVMAQGFRLCFAEQLGGIAYTADELPDEMTTPAKTLTDKQPAKEKAKKTESKPEPEPEQQKEPAPNQDLLDDWEMVLDLVRRISNPTPELVADYQNFAKQIKNNEDVDVAKLREFADKLRDIIGYKDV